MFTIKRKADGLVLEENIPSLREALVSASGYASKHRKTYGVYFQSGAPVGYVNVRGDISWHKQSDRELQAPLTGEA